MDNKEKIANVRIEVRKLGLKFDDHTFRLGNDYANQLLKITGLPPAEEDLPLLTPEEEKQVDDILMKAYQKATEAYRQSEGFSKKPKLPTLDDAIRARLKAQRHLDYESLRSK